MIIDPKSLGGGMGGGTTSFVVSHRLKKLVMQHVHFLQSIGDIRTMSRRAYLETVLREAMLNDLIQLGEERPISPDYAGGTKSEITIAAE